MCNIIVVLFNHSDHRHHRIYTMHKHFIYYAFTCMMQIQFLQWHCKRRISVRNHDIINLPRNRSRFSIFEFKNWIWVCTVCIRVPFEFRLFKWVTTSGFIWPFENRSWSKQWVRSQWVRFFNESKNSKRFHVQHQRKGGWMRNSPSALYFEHVQ